MLSSQPRSNLAGISNGQPRFQTSAEVSNVRPTFRTSSRNSERPGEMSKVRRRVRMLEAWNAGKVQLFIICCAFGINLQIPRKRCQDTQTWTPQTIRRSLRMTWLLNKLPQINIGSRSLSKGSMAQESLEGPEPFMCWVSTTSSNNHHTHISIYICIHIYIYFWAPHDPNLGLKHHKTSVQKTTTSIQNCILFWAYFWVVFWQVSGAPPSSWVFRLDRKGDQVDVQHSQIHYINIDMIAGCRPRPREGMVPPPPWRR